MSREVSVKIPARAGKKESQILLNLTDTNHLAIYAGVAEEFIDFLHNSGPIYVAMVEHQLHHDINLAENAFDELIDDPLTAPVALGVLAWANNELWASANSTLPKWKNGRREFLASTLYVAMHSMIDFSKAGKSLESTAVIFDRTKNDFNALNTPRKNIKRNR